LLHNIKEAAKPVLAQGRDAVVSVILDGENAWEYYPKSGREFLRRFYDALQREEAWKRLRFRRRLPASAIFAFEVAGAGLVDQRELQCLDRRSRR
jgi:hypothetical protein